MALSPLFQCELGLFHIGHSLPVAETQDIHNRGYAVVHFQPEIQAARVSLR